MEWLKRFHIVMIASPWIAALWFRQVWIIIVCLAIHLLVMAQWSILGNCFLNRIENEGKSDESEILLNAADWFQIHPEELKRGYVLINSLAPNFLHLSRLAGALGL